MIHYLEKKMHKLAIALAALMFGTAPALASVTLTHVHGLAYSPDGKRLMLPSHHGLAVYENGKWSKAPGPQHDYMGFSATAKGLYSSGHPAPGSGMVNPFGLIRSRDGGKTWEKLGLEGETDFHLLATSWNTNAIYVWNPAPSSRMRETGLHYTVNEGFAWKRSRAAGLQGDPIALAVHPANATIVAIATSSGVFLSRDSGGSFKPLASGAQGLSVFFDLDGKQLWYGTFDGQPKLARAPLGGGQAQGVALPPLGRDAVAYIAQNPASRGEYAIATFERSVFLSRDGGKTWMPIALRGNGG
ncbi:MAG: F510_1955 family glycosylhydrolase [Betaproteobacteria bacterium]